jgi:TetR/AcrR family transcriptional repressor of nem operon
MSRARSLSDDVVLERAIAVFWRQGYAGASLRDLTRATGLSAAALYHRFADKDGLFVEALRRYADRGLSQRIARFSASASPLEAIRGFFSELIATSAADPDRRGCLLVNTALDGAATSEAVRALVRDRLGDLEAFFAAQLSRAAAAGAIDPEIRIDDAAAGLLGAALGIRVMARLDADPARLNRLAERGLASLQPACDRSAR